MNTERMQRLTLIYVASYLVAGGVGLIAAPGMTLRLLLSTGTYGEVMPRVVGMFMLVLGGLIHQFVRARDYRYYQYTVVARSFIVVVLTSLYFKTRDPLFIVLDVIVLVGLVPSIWIAARLGRSAGRAPSQRA